MGWSIAFAEREWETVLHALTVSRDPLLAFAAGVSRHPEYPELLVQPQRLFSRAPEERRAVVWVYGINGSPAFLPDLPPAIPESIQAATELHPQALLTLGTGAARGYIGGEIYLRGRERRERLEAVRICKSGLPIYALWEKTPEKTMEDEEALRFSRVISGRGLAAFERMSEVRFAVVGISGTGSPIAETLVKEFGVREIVLVDPDTVQPENIHRMQGAGMGDIGRSKAEVVAAYLRTLGPVHPSPVAGAVNTWSALNRLKTCNAWISAVDNGRARAEIQFLAQLYLRPLLDIGVGARLTDEQEHRTEAQNVGRNGERGLPLREILGPYAAHSAPRRWEADIRLVSPGGEGRCLACLGGFGNVRRERRPETEPFWTERPGSSRTANMTAAHLGLNLLENYVSGHLPEESVHLQLDLPADGLPRLAVVRPEPIPRCLFCAARGQGDDGLDRLESALAQIARHEEDRVRNDVQ